MRLYGRAAELRSVDALLQGAGRGEGGTLVVRGPAGGGKTALVAAALAAATGLREVRATGSEFETHLPFAGLQHLCQPLLPLLDRLPPVQGEALRGVLGLGRADGPDPVLIGVSLAGLLSAAAQDGPLVAVVDDVQWLDPASVAALAFVARRTSSLPFALLLLARDDAAPDGLDRLPELRLAPLDRQASSELLTAAVGVPLDPRVRDQLVADAQGNPLALLELPRSAGVHELAGGYGLAQVTPVQGLLERGFQRRVAALPEPARRLLTVAAAEPTGDPGVLWAAAGELGLTARDARPAEQDGLLVVGARIGFRHPLVRTSAYRSADLAQRRDAHAALARHTDPEVMPDHRAWHLALAADGPDEATAQELLRTADHARERGGWAAQAAFLQHAAALTPDPAVRVGRLLDAAGALRTAGASDQALELLGLAEGGRLDAGSQARAQALRARLRFDQRRDAGAVHALLAAGTALAPHDPAAAREVLFDAHAALVFMGRWAPPELAGRLTDAVRSLPAAATGPTARDRLLDALLRTAGSGPTGSAPALRDAVRAAVEEPPATPTTAELWLGPSVAQQVWDEEAFAAVAEAQLGQVRARGVLSGLPVGLSYRALVHLHRGDLDAAQRLVDEAARVAAEIETPAMPHVAMSLTAWRGEEEVTRRLAGQALESAAVRREGRLVTITHYALVVLLNGLGRYDEALDTARESAELGEQSIFGWIGPEVVEAAARAGRPAEAERVLQLLADRAGAFPTDWARGMHARCRALLAGDDAEDSFQEALRLLGATTARGHVARTHLLYGEWLRREGRRREARVQLRTARTALARMGARGFEARASRELAATGERARSRSAAQPVELTPQERTVAGLVASGATSREVAAELFLSPRTVEAHLRSIFGKLGLTSRRQLAGLPELTAVPGAAGGVPRPRGSAVPAARPAGEVRSDR